MDNVGGMLDHFVDQVCEWLEVLAFVDLQPVRPDIRATPRHVLGGASNVDHEGAHGGAPMMHQVVHVDRGQSQVARLAAWHETITRTN